MKISINKGCFGTTIKILNKDFSKSELDTYKEILLKMIDKIEDETQLNYLIRDMAYYFKPTKGEYDNCGQCGDDNSYEEFEI